MPDPIVERWQDAVTRRVRALIRTEPLHEAERTKARRDLDLSRVDLRALALRVLDVVIEEMGLGRGANRSDIVRALGDMVTSMAPELTDARDEVSNIVVDSMLNAESRRQAFSARYIDWSDSPVARELQWHLVQEVELPDGDFVLRATTEGINVYTGMLEVDVQDAQIAEEAVLHAQIRRGRIRDAVRTAQNARLRSIEYATHLARVLRLVERDVAQISWRNDIAGVLDQARDHLDERLDVERSLIDQVDSRLDEANDDDAPRFAELVDIIRDCQKRHIRLHREVIGAGTKFLDEQERQVFRPRVLLTVPDLESEVFVRALAVPCGPLGEALPGLLRALVPAAARPQLYVPQLADRLLAPTTSAVPEPVELQPIVLETIDSERPFYADEDEEVVARLLSAVARRGRCYLSELLAELRELGGSERAESLLVLSTLRRFDPSEPVDRAEVTVRPGGRRLDDVAHYGEDIIVAPLAAASEPNAVQRGEHGAPP